MMIETVVVGPLQENSYIVACDKTHDAVIIDPGAEAERIYQAVREHGLSVQMIVATHGHPDHVGAVAEMLRLINVPFVMHQADLAQIKTFEFDPLRFMLGASTPPTPTRFLQHGEEIQVGTLSFTVLHTPGHTPGGVCLLCEHALFSGDTLFAGSIGRTDLPGGDYDQLIASIQTHLLPLDEAVNVYAGHGPASTIGAERRSNPFLRNI